MVLESRGLGKSVYFYLVLFLFSSFLFVVGSSSSTQGSEENDFPFLNCRDVVARFGAVDLDNWKGQGVRRVSIPDFLSDPTERSGREYLMSASVRMDGVSKLVPKIFFDFEDQAASGEFVQPQVVFMPQHNWTSPHLIEPRLSRNSEGNWENTWSIGHVLSFLFRRSTAEDHFVLPIRDRDSKVFLDRAVSQVLAEHPHLGLSLVEEPRDLLGLHFDPDAVSFLSEADLEDFGNLYKLVNRDPEIGILLVEALEGASVHANSSFALSLSPLEWTTRVILVPDPKVDMDSRGHFAFRYGIFLSPLMGE